MWSALWRRRAAKADPNRWVVLDVETSGLDVSRDRLLAIAAVAVRHDARRAWIDIGDSFEMVLLQPGGAAVPDKDNILLHGIGVGAQSRGIEPAAALQAFEAFAGTSPLLGFHAAFDRRMIERALSAVRRRKLPNPWLDIADLAEVLHPASTVRSLDQWFERFGIRCAQRHQAAADTMATAELLLRLWPAARAEEAKDFRAFAAIAARRPWLGSAPTR